MDRASLKHIRALPEKRRGCWKVGQERAWTEGTNECTSAFRWRLLDNGLGPGALAKRAERTVHVNGGCARPRLPLCEEGTETCIGERKERELLARARFDLAQEAALWRIERARPVGLVIRAVPRLDQT